MRSSSSSTRRTSRRCTHRWGSSGPRMWLRPRQETRRTGSRPIEDLFTVEDLGGWDALNEKLFAEDGIVTVGIANAG